MITAKIKTKPNGYGFGHDWFLEITKDGVPKLFMLGQDAKVCHRCLGSYVSQVIEAIGGRNLGDPEINRNLTNLILQEYAQNPAEIPEIVAEDIYDNLEPWELAVE